MARPNKIFCAETGLRIFNVITVTLLTIIFIPETSAYYNLGGFWVQPPYVNPVNRTNCSITPDTSQSFSYTGSDQNFTVPTGVTCVTVKAWGAGGGNGTSGGQGGAGGYAERSFTVTPAESLITVVGQGDCAGTSNFSTPTWGYGKGGCDDLQGGGGGGGFSGVFFTSVIPDNVLIVAGGGGGAGKASAGGAGGGSLAEDGAQISCVDGMRGTGATQERGGYGGEPASGTCSPAVANQNGSLLLGGQIYIPSNYYGAGGGGGGWYGGGGGGGDGSGSNGAGGGGGSAYAPGGTVTAGVGTTPGNSGDPDRGTAGNPAVAGKVVYSWEAPCAGTKVGGGCWYHGTAGQSCTTVCATHGGYNALTNTYAGGGQGNRTNCVAVAAALGINTSLSYDGGPVNYGCTSNNSSGYPYWFNTNPTTEGSTNAAYRRICACNQ